MKWIDWAVLAVVAALLAAVIAAGVRKRRRGGGTSCGGCSGCPMAGSCARRNVPQSSAEGEKTGNGPE